MPGAGRRIWPRGEKRLSWSDYPFSYIKICRTLEVILLAIAAVTLGLTGAWSRHTPWVVLVWLAFGIVIVSLVLERLVWRAVPAGVREHIPYDASEALERKGAVHSYKELLKLLWHRESA